MIDYTRLGKIPEGKQKMKISAAALAAALAVTPAPASAWAPQINPETIAAAGIPAPSAPHKALPKDGQNYSGAEELLIKEFAVTGISLDVPEAEVMRQDHFYNNAFCFEHALRLSLLAVLGDYAEPTSPLARELSSMGVLSEPSKSQLKLARERVFHTLNKSGSLLAIVRPYKLNQPMNGEMVEKNWILFLRLDGKPYWVVVDRAGETAPYVYGMN
jgi:hypothetical protein